MVTPVPPATNPSRPLAAEMLGPGKHRAALQAIDDALRAEDPDVLIAAARRRTAALPRWVITDARSAAEVTDWPDALTVTVMAPLAQREARLRQRDGVASSPCTIPPRQWTRRWPRAWCASTIRGVWRTWPPPTRRCYAPCWSARGAIRPSRGLPLANSIWFPADTEGGVAA